MGSNDLSQKGNSISIILTQPVMSANSLKNKFEELGKEPPPPEVKHGRGLLLFYRMKIKKLILS